VSDLYTRRRLYHLDVAGRLGEACAYFASAHQVVIITPNAPNVDGPITLEPLGGGRFRCVAPAGGGAVGEGVRFVAQTGRSMRMYIGDGWIDRVP